MRWIFSWGVAVIVGIGTNVGVTLWTYRTFSVQAMRLWYVHLALAVVSFTVPIVLFGLLTHRIHRPRHDGETHCRRCDYILRGIPEPRCPECGERI